MIKLLKLLQKRRQKKYDFQNRNHKRPVKIGPVKYQSNPPRKRGHSSSLTLLKSVLSKRSTSGVLSIREMLRI